MAPRRAVLAPIQPTGFTAPRPTALDGVSRLGSAPAQSIVSPPAPQPLVMLATKPQRKRTDAPTAVWCDETTTTLIDQEEAWQEESAGKQVHASVSFSHFQLLSKD